MTPSSASRSQRPPDSARIHPCMNTTRRPPSFFLVYLGPTTLQSSRPPYMTDSARLSSCRSLGWGIRGGGTYDMVTKWYSGECHRTKYRENKVGGERPSRPATEREKHKIVASKAGPVRRRECATKINTSFAHACKEAKKAHRGETAMLAKVFHTAELGRLSQKWSDMEPLQPEQVPRDPANCGANPRGISRVRLFQFTKMRDHPPASESFPS